MEHIHNLLSLIGRIMLSAIFIDAGARKLMTFAQQGEALTGMMKYMADHGVPGNLFPVVGAVELVGGLMILLGFLPRIGALVLAAFTVAAAVKFHNFWAVDAASYQMQYINFMKNMAIAGGMFLLAVNGTGHWSVQKVGKFEMKKS